MLANFDQKSISLILIGEWKVAKMGQFCPKSKAICLECWRNLTKYQFFLESIFNLDLHSMMLQKSYGQLLTSLGEDEMEMLENRVSCSFPQVHKRLFLHNSFYCGNCWETLLQPEYGTDDTKIKYGTDDTIYTIRNKWSLLFILTKSQNQLSTWQY